MKHICHITSVHKRYDGRILRKECASLLENGYKVSLVVADKISDENYNGIDIYSVGTKSGRLQRILTSKRIYRKCIKLDADAFHFHDPELVFVGLLLYFQGKKVVWDMHENIPADIMQKRYIPYPLRTIFLILYKGLERFASKRFDGIVCTRDSVLHRLNGRCKNVVTLFNFPISNGPTVKQSTRRNPSVICFAGAIVPNYQHAEVIEAISTIENVRYVLAGEGNAAYLEKLRLMPGWEKVEYRGLVSFDEVKEIYANADIGLAVHKYTANMDWRVGNFALTKIFEVLLWGLPVVCTRYDIWDEQIFAMVDCGIPVDPESIEEIRAAIRKLVDNPELAQAMGQSGQSYVREKFVWQKEERKLFNLYARIFTGSYATS